MSNPFAEWVRRLVQRPELVTLVAAGVVGALAMAGVPALTGEPLPEAAISNVVAALFAAVGGAIVEGVWKPHYQSGLGTLTGTKMRLALVVVLGNLLIAGFGVLGLEVCGPDVTGACVAQSDIDQISGLLIALIWVRAGWDAGRVQIEQLASQVRRAKF